MFEISTKKVEFGKNNQLIKKTINLDINLDCFILISSNNQNFGELLLNNILDYIIDKISIENTYNDFSISLENINSFIKIWKNNNETKDFKLDVIISILNKNNYLFSTIGKASCYLINSNEDISELTEIDGGKKEFNFVSSGELKNDDIIITSTKRLLKYLSSSDIIDGLILKKDINIFNKNIKNILLSEILKENILISSLKYTSINKKEEKINYNNIKNQILKLLDNNISKKIIAYLLILKDKLTLQSKTIKNIIFLIVITFSIFFIYSILSGIIGATTQNNKNDISRKNIEKINTYLQVASDNIINNEIFEINIQNAEKLIKEVEKEKIYINNLSKINDTINILKKQFNKIEIFEENEQNLIFPLKSKNSVKIIKNNNKPYIISKKGIKGPILPNITPKNYIFNSLEKEENFIDAVFIGNNMYLLTNFSKIVKFTKNNHFSYVDVYGQKTWEKSKEINSYAQNIYLIGKENNQIFKHTLSGNTFKAANGYLKKEDLSQIGEILSIAIDGGFYILKKDLSIVKFYSSPKYRLENIILNKLPKNYNIENNDNKINLKTRPDLNYVYMLLNNKVWIFKPNTKNYRNTQSLTYIGQIEGETETIKDFYINYDGEILILNNKGIYKINFEISDNKLIIR